MSDFRTVAQALRNLGFTVCERHDKHQAEPTAWEGKLSDRGRNTVRAAVALLVNLGLKRDPERFNGHANLWTETHDLVTVWQEKNGNIVVCFTQAS